MQPVPNDDDLVGELASLKIARDELTPGHGLRLWIIGAFVVLATGGATLAGVFLLGTKTVETALVLSIQPGQEAPLFVATATVIAPTTDTLAPRIPGRLMKRLVEEGDEVKESQPIAILDPTDLRLALNQVNADVVSADARVGSARVAVKSAETRASRAQKLFAGSAGTESAAIDAALELDSARAQLRVAEADLGQVLARLSTAKKNLEDTTLRAPFHGVVLKVLAQPGDFVSTAQSQGVVQLADLSSLEVDAEVAEANIAKVTVGMPAEVRLDALPSAGIVGHVFAIRPNVDVAKATAIAKIRLDTAKLQLKMALFPGMNGRASFLQHEPDARALNQAPVLEIPASALLRDGNDVSVLTVDKDGRVKAVTVSTGGADGERIVLKQGPVAGTMVVAQPDGIKAGDRIELPTK